MAQKIAIVYTSFFKDEKIFVNSIAIQHEIVPLPSAASQDSKIIEVEPRLRHPGLEAKLWQYCGDCKYRWWLISALPFSVLRFVLQ